MKFEAFYTILEAAKWFAIPRFSGCEWGIFIPRNEQFNLEERNGTFAI